MGLEALVSDDSRTPIQKLRRSQLWKIAKAYDLSFPIGAPASAMIPIIQGAGIDVTRPLPNGDSEFELINIPTKNGFKQELVPKEKDHYTKNRDIDYDSVIEKKAKEQEVIHKQETDSLRSEIDELKAMIAQLTGQKLEQKLEQKEEIFELTPNYEDMKYLELRKLATQRGLKQSPTDTKEDLVRMLNG